MDSFDKELLLELFLETDTVSTINRVAVAVSGVAQEQSEIIGACRAALKRESLNDSLNPASKRRKAFECVGFYENIILNYTDRQYEERFKMKRSTVQKLMDYIGKNASPSVTRVSFDKKLHVFIWLLTSGCSYSEVGSVFGLHKSSISYILHEVGSLLADLRFDLIRWPTIDQQHVTRITVSSRAQFPNCVGFIDSCRLKVGSKRKKDSSEIVLLQAVCDETLKFTNIYVGNVSETRKAKVFRDSPLSKELKNIVDFENHILGDSGYKLKKNLMTPFSSSEVLTREEMYYNDVHWRTRAYIDAAFGRLQSKFKKLNHIELNNPEAISTLVNAACVLHNFLLRYEPDEETVKCEPVTYGEGVTIDTSVVNNASEKRQFLCNYVNYLDDPSETA